YNGVDKSKFFQKKSLKHSGIFHIGCVANFSSIKDQITLIKATEILINQSNPNIKVTFVGTGPTRGKCEEYIYKNNLSKFFNFIDSIPHRQLNDFYNEIDLFVLPSYYEALGCVYLEAYSTGTPFVGVYDQGIEELI